jgi:hypothetical protein
VPEIIPSHDPARGTNVAWPEVFVASRILLTGRAGSLHHQ